MQEQILEMITVYGIETIIIALAINILTGIVKLPIKAISRRMKDGTSLTRWIVFLPVILAAGLTYGYARLKTGNWVFGDSEITIWLTASSLSLSIYAILEKMFPSKRKILEKYEVDENKKLIETIKTITNNTCIGSQSLSSIDMISTDNESQDSLEPIPQESETPIETMPEREKIVLRGGKK